MNPASPALEVNLDGLPGPTHHFGGLAYGNLASMENRSRPSNPKQAAIQVVIKMKLLCDFGVPQMVFPPHERPHLPTLYRLGFRGSPGDVIADVAREAPKLLLACSSSSGMWLANAATVSPSPDTPDQTVHFTPANLVSQFHRSIEPPFTQTVLRRLFPDPDHFTHHDPLPRNHEFADEGAANHSRLTPSYGDSGIECFVYGRSAEETGMSPKRFPARQAEQAARAIARRHRLRAKQTWFGQQAPLAIDQGVFHNDVIAVGNLNLLLCHSEAYLDQAERLQALKTAFREETGEELIVRVLSSEELPLKDAVQSYFFNSQLIGLPDGGQTVIAPKECRENPAAQACLVSLRDEENPIRSFEFTDLTESMQNGGGPACLRLRIVLTEKERRRAHPDSFLTPTLYESLLEWIDRHYREMLHVDDLRDPALLEESHTALDELTRILNLGSIYSFQS